MGTTDITGITTDATNWLSFDADTRTFAGTPLTAHVSAIGSPSIITITATDNALDLAAG